MENKKFNLMNSQVQDGYKCKPKKLDPNKPIMHFKTQIFICSDKRCSSKNTISIDELRQIIKDLNLEKGKNRIKISKSFCFGACRYKQVANIYENTKANGYITNNNIWLKHTHKYTKEQWKNLFIALSKNQSIDKLNYNQIKISNQDSYE